MTTPDELSSRLDAALLGMERAETGHLNDLDLLEERLADLQAHLNNLNTSLRNITAGLDAARTKLDADGLHWHHTVTPLLEEVRAISAALTLLDEQPPSWQPAFPGDTPPGVIRWGCAQPNNGLPTEHEAAAAVPIGVRRTFWRLDQTTRLVETARADVTAGRVPWVSIKLTSMSSWAAAAQGRVDTNLAVLFAKLGALAGPVWLTAHHEPEGGNGTPHPDEGVGSEQHWRAMQRRVRQVLDASGATNIAFGPTLMAWTFSPSSGRNPSDWWVDDIWDFAGIDNYVEAAATTVRTTGWDNAVEFYRARGLKVAVGEWGNKDHGPSGANEMRDWYDHLIDINSPGACYFDTNANGGVPLSGHVLAEFRRLMADQRSTRSWVSQ
jgi:hypothetical protein